MNLNQLLGAATHFLKVNSPVIASVGAGVGTVATAYLTAKASFRAAEVIRANEVENVPSDEPRKRLWQRTCVVWKLYLPPALAGVSTLCFIAAANRFSAQKTLAATSALAVSERAYSSYRDKVVEEFSKRKDQSIRDKVVAEQIERNPPTKQVLALAGPGKVLCCELYTMRYFISDMESLRKAENQLNAHLLKHDYVTLNEFYYHVGLRQTSVSGELGWTSDHLLELIFSTTMSEDNQPCIAFDYNYIHPV
ncbi:MAG: DUF6353 family protein [Chitinophagaceae bacterium]